MVASELEKVRMVIRCNWAGVVGGRGIHADIDKERSEGVRGWVRQGFLVKCCDCCVLQPLLKQQGNE